MRKTLLFVALLALMTMPLLAQNHPKAEVFGGYQFTHISYGFPSGTTGINTSDNFNGWNAALTVWANNWLGVTGDFSGAYKSDAFASHSGINVHQYTFMFGPTIASHKNEKFVPFAHALFGGAHCSVSGVPASSDCIGTDSNSFAFALGGGLDVGSKKIAFRVGQFDYMRAGFGQNVPGQGHQNEFRYSAGIVFRF